MFIMQFIMKGCNSGTASWKSRTGQGVGKGLITHPLSLHLRKLTSLGASVDPILWSS